MTTLWRRAGPTACSAASEPSPLVAFEKDVTLQVGVRRQRKVDADPLLAGARVWSGSRVPRVT